MSAMDKLKKMNKKALEEYGRTVGIELDRRLTKKALVKQVEEYLEVEDSEGPALVSKLADALEVAHANEGNEKEVEKIEKSRPESSEKVLLRDKNTGRFSKGDQPPGNPTATYGGKPYWEV